MTPAAVVQARLLHQGIERSAFRTPLEVVQHLGAMQAQDYLAARWAIGSRLPGSTEVSVEQAIRRAQVIRTWPMRGTLHFVPPADAKWMLELMGRRVVAGASARHRQLELNEAILGKSTAIITKELAGKKLVSRRKLLDALERDGIATNGGRGYHILKWTALQGIIFVGPLEGTQQTFGLLDEWVPKPVELSREEALATIAQRYFASHGPASLKDFVWWSGLKISDARTAVESIRSQLASIEIANQVLWMSRETTRSISQDGTYFLPPFDEYLVGYTDRSAALEVEHAPKVIASKNGMFFPIIVYQGQIVGTWRRAIQKDTVVMTTRFLAAPPPRSEIQTAAQRYADFVHKKLQLQITLP